MVELNNGMKKAINQLTQQIISSSVYQNFVEKRNTLSLSLFPFFKNRGKTGTQIEYVVTERI